ncbi:mitotic spindle checkpoint protein BUBR1-like isoform X1 [Hibiscus syriacus]|uniref:mitotic spindle checkpoint protein BUBR1-like isoform X1 n=1 Tax=Hibiscus syriacus TaxID=106335 RepID=UPI0019224E51|nr:mitotic spindle checkpoint protein BUBR1-like isoform X1 [Hibiscus syriacus]
MDPETEFLVSKRKTGNEWELFKENVRPLKRGRNVDLLNHALKAHTDDQLKKSLLDNRRRLIEAIDEYEGEDPLQPWLDCIKWVQEAFPPGGDFSGLVLIYEQCVRAFWHSDRYKDDLRYLKIWLEYAEHCSDAEVIYSFLDANDIGKTHSAFYIAYALHMESKSKMKAANDILNRGISSNAQPIEKLKDAYKKFLARSMRGPKETDEELKDDDLPTRSFGALLARGESQRQANKTFELGRNKLKQENHRIQRTPLSIYNDNNMDVMRGHPSKPSTYSNSWHTLGGRAERNKENNAVPAKWTSYKVPQRPVPRTMGTGSSAHIEVFVDEECAEMPKAAYEKDRTSSLQLRELDGKNIKKETELLRENPLRNFPSNSLPR